MWAASFGERPAAPAPSALAALAGPPGRALSPRRALPGGPGGPARWRTFVCAMARVLGAAAARGEHAHVLPMLGVVPLDRHGLPEEEAAAATGAATRTLFAPLYIVTERGTRNCASGCVPRRLRVRVCACAPWLSPR